MKKAAVVVALAGLAGAAGAQTVYDSISPWDGTTSVQSWGDPNTATYGQTFSVPQNGDNVLTSFTFAIRDTGTPVDHDAAIYEWGGDRPVGGALFSTFGTTSGSGAYELYSYSTGGVALDPTRTYVAFLSASNYFPTGGGAAWGHPQNQDFIPGGEFVFINNGGNFNDMFNNAWFQGWLGAGNDVAGEFVFVPAPGALALLGLGGLAAARRRR